MSRFPLQTFCSFPFLRAIGHRPVTKKSGKRGLNSLSKILPNGAHIDRGIVCTIHTFRCGLWRSTLDWQWRWRPAVCNKANILVQLRNRKCISLADQLLRTNRTAYFTGNFLAQSGSHSDCVLSLRQSEAQYFAYGHAAAQLSYDWPTSHSNIFAVVLCRPEEGQPHA